MVLFSLDKNRKIGTTRSIISFPDGCTVMSNGLIVYKKQQGTFSINKLTTLNVCLNYLSCDFIERHFSSAQIFNIISLLVWNFAHQVNLHFKCNAGLLCPG